MTKVWNNEKACLTKKYSTLAFLACAPLTSWGAASKTWSKSRMKERNIYVHINSWKGGMLGLFVPLWPLEELLQRPEGSCEWMNDWWFRGFMRKHNIFWRAAFIVPPWPLEELNCFQGYKDGLQPETLADGNWLVKQNQPVSKIGTKSDTNLRSLYESWFRNALISKSVILWWQAKKGIYSELEGANARRVLNIPSKKVSVSHAQLAHFSTLAKEKHMLLILNFSTLTFIANARTTMPFARLHSQMVCTQSEPAEIPQHMFVQILVQVGGDRKRRTSRTTLKTPTPLVIRHWFLACLLREDMKN